MRSARALVLLAALLVGGCEAGGVIVPIAPQPATLQDLTGPWRTTPFLLDPAWRAKIEAACRRDMQAPVGATSGIIDARGGGVVTVRLTGGGAAKCEALEITEFGEINGAGGGMSGGREPAESPPDGMLGFPEIGNVEGGMLTVKGWSVMGRAGRGIARVEVVTTTHPPIVATLENGWYSAWWPTGRGDSGVQGVIPDAVIRGFDVAGYLVSERRAQ